MSASLYDRVEFKADLGSGPIVVVFVDFSSQGISFGVPLNVKIYEGTPEDPSPNPAISEYQRVTVHADGRVETHLPTPTPLPELKELDRHMPPLSQWKKSFCRRLELVWTPDQFKFTRRWLAKPKPNTHSSCKKVEVEFNQDAVSTVVYICVMKPGMDINKVSPAPAGEFQSWFLTGGWPWVLVQMSNVKSNGINQLSTIGRNYQHVGTP